MCGIACRPGVLAADFDRTLQALAFRGPDQSGTISLLDYTLGCRRLAITDVAATQLGRLAIAMAAIVADKYGWYAVKGTLIPGASLASATDAKNAFSVSTAGSVDDSGAGAEVLIFGAFYVSAVDTPSSGLAYFALNYPFMTGLTLD